jgi:hypothetical protein
MAPERELEETGLHPGIVHLVDILGLVPLLGEERIQGEGHRENEREQVTKRHNRARIYAIGLVLLRAVVAQPDLMLMVEQLLVVLGAGSIENPLTEAFAHTAQIVPQRLAVALAEEGLEQLRLRTDELPCRWTERLTSALYLQSTGLGR